MDMGVPLRELGKVDCQGLIDAVGALAPAVWDSCDVRQKVFDVHKRTKSIVMVFADGWPDIKVQQYPGWPVLASVAMPVASQIIRDHYPAEGNIIRLMVANLLAGGEIEVHRDAAPLFGICHRIHVPLQTNDRVQFQIGDEIFYLQTGFGYEVNNRRFHGVRNESDQDRWHLIFDYLPPGAIEPGS